jgi:glycosyltransferase involved in cell wall biosynthesis
MSLRIAIISEHASPLAMLGGVDSGGQNVYVAQTACHLVRLGHRVDVYTRRDDQTLPDVLQSPDGYQVIHVPAGPPRRLPKEDLLPFMGEFTDHMLWRLKARPADLIHANFFMSGLVGMELKSRLALPLVVTFHALGRVRLLHQGGADRFPADRLEIEDELMQAADYIVAECPQDADDQRHLYDADPRKIRIVPCGYDPEEMHPIGRSQARRVLGLDRSMPLVLQLGRLVPRKGVDDAIRGFARAVKRMKTTARMLVVGGESETPSPELTPEIGRLQCIAQEEGIGRQVVFTGRAERARLKYYYSAANVFVTTPWYEPFGITPLEAMACATPVVGSNVGGIKHTVVDGKTGFLVPPHDPDSVGECLAALLNNSEQCRQFGEEALRRVRQGFTWKKVAEALNGIYQEAAARPRRRRLARAASSPAFEFSVPILADSGVD